MRRHLFVLLLAFAAMVAVGRAADREWQTGTWGKAPAARGVSAAHAYVIETDDFEYQVQETVARGSQPLAATAGQPVTFAFDANEKNTIYIREGDDGERSLRLVRTTRKFKIYSASGAGHYIRSMADGGLTLTLEDGSVWDLDPTRQFNTIEWQANDGISVRGYNEDDNFDYFITNTDEDLGAPAKLRKAP